MGILQPIHCETGKTLSTVAKRDSFSDDTRDGEQCTVYEFLPPTDLPPRWDSPGSFCKGGRFFRNLSSEAINDFESLAKHFCCPSAAVLIREEQEPSSIILLIGGRVKLSMNSGDGRRLIVKIAEPGEILGLASAVSGCPYDITAEAQFPCAFSSIERESFLDFLARYPAACLNVARQLSLDDKRTFEQLRTLGLTLTAHAKLARLLLDWCLEGEQSARGTRVQCSFTHEEIGEHIGASRETITRCMNDFKNQGLVEQRGTTLFIPNRSALGIYAGMISMPDPHNPAPRMTTEPK